MKRTLILGVCLLIAYANGFTQNDSIRINSTWEMGKLRKIIPTGPAKIKAPQQFRVNEHPERPLAPSDSNLSKPNEYGPGTFYEKSSGTNEVSVIVGTSFEGNHMFGGTPADNALAISNDGKIVSIDNATVAYFKENGDTVVKFGLPSTDWYQDSTLTRAPFDPRVIYDHDSDRFICVQLYRSGDYSDARILVSFSQPLVADSISWNHYQIDCDSIYKGIDDRLYWIDYPTIAINKQELFISANVISRDTLAGTNSKTDRLVLQIEKLNGYAGLNGLNSKNWKLVENTEGNTNGTLVPLSDAFQNANYGPGCYMVSNYRGNSTKFFWYELTGDINDNSAQIVAHLTATSFFYSFPSFASQMGGNGGDRISVFDCDIQSGFYQSGKLHFVFHRSDNGWGEIVYAKIDISTNTFVANTWGGIEDTLNSLFPAIAPYGKDSTEENAMIAFLRTGPTIFPQVCAINFDTAWSPGATIVKLGEGIIDLRADLVAPWDSLERLGDYIDIQRRYNDPQNACWLAASYSAGSVANHFGVSDGVKAWIAELGDSMLVGFPFPVEGQSFGMFPNPIVGEEGLNFELGSNKNSGGLRITDMRGVQVMHTRFTKGTFSIKISKLPAGVYFVTLNSKKNRYATQKLLILP